MKFAALLAFVAVSLFSQQTPASLPEHPAGFVTDAAHVLSQEDTDALTHRCQEIDKSHLAQIAIVTITSLHGEPIETASLRRFRKWGVGRKGVDDGLMLFLAIEDRKSRLAVGLGLEKSYPMKKAAAVLSAMRPDLSDGNYAQPFPSLSINSQNC